MLGYNAQVQGQAHVITDDINARTSAGCPNRMFFMRIGLRQIKMAMQNPIDNS